MQANEINILIHKQISGIISPDEARMLRDWMQKSPENQAHFEEIEKAWFAFVDPADSFKPNVNKGLQRLNSRIDVALEPIQLKPIEAKSIPIRSILIRLAAVVVLTFGLFWTVQQFSANQSIVAYQTEDQVQSWTLEDGSIITLNARTRIEIINFDEKTRDLKLTGEAYFDVARDQNRPFNIFTSKSKVEVLGTAFNVRAFNHEPFTEVQVERGQVAVLVEGQRVDLEKMDKATYFHEDRMLKTGSDASLNAIAWKTGYLDFNDVALSQVFQTLERQFNIKFLLDGLDLEKCNVFSDFDSDSLEVVLETLKTLFNFDYEISGQLVKISGSELNCK